MLQVKITFRLDFLTYGKLILNFFCILALIIHELGHGDKENWESTFGSPEKTTDILPRHQLFLGEMMSEKRVRKLHTDDASLPRSG